MRLFAGLRERAGWSQREIEAATVGDVWPALELGDEPGGLLYAVNKEYATRDRALADGDEVALIPPVSGGAFLLSDEPLSLDRGRRRGARRRGPARSRRSRARRGSSRAAATSTHLDYEAYEGMAEQVMAEIADALQARYELLRRRDPPPHRARRDRRARRS